MHEVVVEPPALASVIRLARVSGIKCLSKESAFEIRKLIVEYIAEIARALHIVRDQQGAKTIMLSHARTALDSIGMKVSLP